MACGDVVDDVVDGDYSEAGWLFELDDDGKVFSVAVGIAVFYGNVVSVDGGDSVDGDVVVVMIMIVEVDSCCDQMIVTLLVSLVIVCCWWMLTKVILW